MASVSFRKALGWSHRWLGFIAGLFFCALAFTGGIVTFRPQLAMLLAPPAPQTATCAGNVDWNRAERQIEDYAHAHINRIYAPTGSDQRYRLRIMTDVDAIYNHVIFDGCTGTILGTANLGWMDWLVDVHHNLRAGRTGRTVGGWLGVLLFFSAIGGMLFWLLAKTNFSRLLNIRQGHLMWRDLHAASGALASTLLIVASFTGICLCFPQTTRAALAMISVVPTDVRVPRPAAPPGGTPMAGLGDIIHTAERSIPGAVWREIRMPDGYGNVQVRMWLPNDFRWLGNNVVTVNRANAQALGVDLYSTKTASQRFIQAMAGLHYGEWGGLTYRSVYGIAGLLAAFLFFSGILLWWLPKLKASSKAAKSVPSPNEAELSVSRS